MKPTTVAAIVAGPFTQQQTRMWTSDRTVMKRYKTVIIRISRHILYCKVVFIRLSGPDYIYVDTKNRLFQRKSLFGYTLHSGSDLQTLVKK